MLAQKATPDYSLDLSIGVANISSAGLMFRKNFYLGAKRKIVIAPAIRLAYATGQSVDYISAPNDITSDDMKVDTVAFGGTGIFSPNLAINLGYRVNDKLTFMFDIDLFGISLGKDQVGTFRPGSNSSNGANATWKQPSTGFSSSPTSPNILLLGDKYKGSLSSAFTMHYAMNESLSFKLGAGYLFTEYTTTGKLGAAANNRWRAKTLQGVFGASYHF